MRILAVVSLLTPACQLLSRENIGNLILGATDTVQPSETPTETAEPTPVQFTDTPVPPPIATTVPPTLANTIVPPSPTPGMAIITLINNLSVSLKLKLKGPVLKTVTINPNSEFVIEIPPGTYEFSASAPNLIPLTGTREFSPGENEWSFGKKR